MSVSFDVRQPTRRPFSIVDLGCNPTYDSPYALAVLADSPAGYWQMQECPGFLPQDSSGNGYHMNDFNIFGDELWRQAGMLTSPNDASMGATLPNSATHFTAGIVSTVVDDFTMELFLKIPANLSNDRNLFHNGTIFVDGWGIALDEQGGAGPDTIKFLASGIAFGSLSSVLTPGGEYQIVVVRDSGTWSYYLNGALDVANAGTTTPNVPTGGIEIALPHESGLISHVALYEVALTAGQIAAHYAAH